MGSVDQVTGALSDGVADTGESARLDGDAGSGIRDAATGSDGLGSAIAGTGRGARTLVSTPQQQVVVESGCIEVLPAQPDVIYVPVYDPAVVYVARLV